LPGTGPPTPLAQGSGEGPTGGPREGDAMTTSTTGTSTTKTSTTKTSTTETAGAGGAGARLPSPAPRRGSRARAAAGPTTAASGAPGRNEVRLSGRLAAKAEERELPSGDRIVTLRVVVSRAPSATRRRQPVEGPKRATVDTIDVVCWTAGTRRTALRLRADELVEVEGALRRRFFGGPSGRQSRYEVEASALRRASGGALTGT
jgi:single-strand DNA-binding protein